MGNNNSTSTTIEILNDIYQKRMTNIILQSDTTVINASSLSQSLTVNVTGKISCENAFDIFQNITADYKWIGQIDTKTLVNLQTALKDDLTNKTSQTVKIIRQMLSDIGSTNTDDTLTKITNRVSQIIDTRMTIQHTNRIMNSSINYQNNTINITGEVTAKECSFSQNIFVAISAKAIVNDLINTISNDDTVNRIINDATQDVTVKAEGLEGLITGILNAGTLPLIVICVTIIIGLAIVGKEGVKAFSNPEFILGAGACGLVYLGLAYKLKWFPFKPPTPKEYWKCEQDSKTQFYTGKCVQATDATDGMYSSQKQCETAIANGKCGQYWGCEKNPNPSDTVGQFTGKCIQYGNALDGPYSSQEICDQKVRDNQACREFWGCGGGTSDDDKTNQCYTQPDLQTGSYKSKSECLASGTCK